MNKREFIKKSALGLATTAAAVTPIAAFGKREEPAPDLSEYQRMLNDKLRNFESQIAYEIVINNPEYKREAEETIKRNKTSFYAVEMCLDKDINSDTKWAMEVVELDSNMYCPHDALRLFRKGLCSDSWVRKIILKHSNAEAAFRLLREKDSKENLELTIKMAEKELDSWLAFHLMASYKLKPEWAKRIIENKKDIYMASKAFNYDKKKFPLKWVVGMIMSNPNTDEQKDNIDYLLRWCDSESYSIVKKIREKKFGIEEIKDDNIAYHCTDVCDLSPVPESSAS